MHLRNIRSHSRLGQRNLWLRLKMAGAVSIINREKKEKENSRMNRILSSC